MTSTSPGARSAEDLTEDNIRDAYRAIEYYYEQGWTDGLPVVPPIREKVQEFIDYVKRNPDEVVAEMSHLDRRCTVELAAINAVMAGCLKEHLPVVLAAFACFKNGLALVQSTTGQAQLIVVNGPVRGRLNFNTKAGVFGPGFRANATVSRAFRLIVMNALGVRPHEFDQGTQGTPAKYGFCIAENEEDSPWEPLHVERGFSAEHSTVTAHFARSCLHVENRISNSPEQVALTIADSLSYAGVWFTGWCRGSTVVIGPTHAQLFDTHGWSKADVKQFLWEHWGRKKGDLRAWGEYGVDAVHAPFPGAYEEGPDEEFLRFGQSPDSLTIVVAGAPSAGVSAVITHFSPNVNTERIVEPA
jgi:hypothetical protein